jgi:hypothetical protein
MMSIEFEKLGMPVFTGRPRGVALRKKLKLDSVDEVGERVSVDIPEDVYTVTSSFFLGLFGPSVRHYGSKNDFLCHYSFKAPERVASRLDEWVDRALRDKGAI